MSLQVLNDLPLGVILCRCPSILLSLFFDEKHPLGLQVFKQIGDLQHLVGLLSKHDIVKAIVTEEDIIFVLRAVLLSAVISHFESSSTIARVLLCLDLILQSGPHLQREFLFLHNI
ncbi:hypothetical protein FGO68_gene7353 [Halteria grandinella]|uniref:Uncharacterized protein n=1 Tax=Halteria grandinella TaxID=5974 RepID=A0A8J8T4V0_HALGN|nr:hypothetical protein FGO68_gene7353 [Halteria grandinella]